jgi:hypothetical protein
MQLRIHCLQGVRPSENVPLVKIRVTPHYVTAVTFPLQPDNGGIVMVNFYSGFVNCKSAAEATLDDVVGMYTELVPTKESLPKAV